MQLTTELPNKQKLAKLTEGKKKQIHNYSWRLRVLSLRQEMSKDIKELKKRQN